MYIYIYKISPLNNNPPNKKTPWGIKLLFTINLEEARLPPS